MDGAVGKLFVFQSQVGPALSPQCMSTRPGRNQRGEDRNEHEAMVQRREECGVLRLPAPFGLRFRSCPPDGITIKRANFFWTSA